MALGPLTVMIVGTTLVLAGAIYMIYSASQE